MEIIIASAVLVLVTVIGVAAIGRDQASGTFLKRLFLGAVLVRAALGVVIYTLKLEEFFGGDAITYDTIGYDLYKAAFNISSSAELTYRLSTDSSGWGMPYWVAAVYTVTGRNPLAIQFLNAFFGALTAVVIFYIGEKIYRHRLVAERAAMLSAFFPSLILWSSQGLKDPIILLALCLIALGTLHVRERFAPAWIGILLFAFFVLYAFRFYVFYIMAAAVAGAILLGSVRTVQGFVRQAVVGAVIVGVLVAAGVGQQAARHYESIDLNKIQTARADLANRAASGFGSEIDVRTSSGFLTALPVGTAYLLLAPFPWQFSSVRQAITLPEMLVWWSLIPLLISGLIYTVRYRLGESSTILIFTFGLIIAYALLQGNVGTAYRQRSQILVFFFLFVAAGWTLRTIRKQGGVEARR